MCVCVYIKYTSNGGYGLFNDHSSTARSDSLDSIKMGPFAHNIVKQLNYYSNVLRRESYLTVNSKLVTFSFRNTVLRSLHIVKWMLQDLVAIKEFITTICYGLSPYVYINIVNPFL